jgi:hypothetical protein
MGSRSAEVDRFLEELDHPLKSDVMSIRTRLHESNDAVTERIKWNAPSFGLSSEDRVTFNLRPTDKIQLVFHRGAKVKDTSSFTFTDESGMLTWLAKDRATVVIPAGTDPETYLSGLIDLINAWMTATHEKT